MGMEHGETGGGLRGRTALVTGGAKRIGRALCRGFASAGADVVVHYHRSRKEAEAAVAEVCGLGVRAWAVGADLSRQEGAVSLWEAACECAGPIDLLVNNAAVFPESRLADFGFEELTRNVALHAMAPLVLARALHAAKPESGAIVNLLDARIVDYDSAHVAYHLSKRMLFALTRMMAVEFAPAVRVNAVAPGLILPPEGEGPEYLERLAKTNPLQCAGRPGDIARAALFLAESGFVTGQVVFVDGGRHLIGKMYD
jgi:NAD(P)-dependent dehydrogenase (short-subunit alcohol dehydrogenase family)